MVIRVRYCKDADKEQAASKRQYAHTGHVACRICVAAAFFGLPRGYRAGLLAHEFGHMSPVHDPKHSEYDADAAAHWLLGVQIQYKTTKKYGHKVEWLNQADTKRLFKEVNFLVDNPPP